MVLVESLVAAFLSLMSAPDHELRLAIPRWAQVIGEFLPPTH
jgi:hypothetical protein